jgi:hypothetical protein
VKTYEGRRDYHMTIVTVNGQPLDPRVDLWEHSSGFEWGYGGSGPAQLALALLADHLDDDEQAVALHQEFKWAVVANLSRPTWTLTSDQIEKVLRALQPAGQPPDRSWIGGPDA